MSSMRMIEMDRDQLRGKAREAQKNAEKGTKQSNRRGTRPGQGACVVWMVGLVLWLGSATGCETGFRPGGGFATASMTDLESLEPMRALELFPLRAQTGVYERKSGDRSGREYEYELRREGEDWVFEVEGRHRIYLRQQEDGGIGLYRYEDLRKDVQVEATPAMLMLPGEIDDQVHEGLVQLTVHGLFGRRTMHGEGYYRLRVAGTRSVQTPEGEREAYIIEQEQQVRMPLARAQVQIETAYVAGMGRVVDRLVHEHRVIGLFGSNSQESYQLIK